MPSPIMIDPNYGETVNIFQESSTCFLSIMPYMICDLFVLCTYKEMCPDDIPPSEGLSALNSLLEAKMGHRIARFLDALFDVFVN